MYRLILLISLLSSGFCDENYTTDIQEENFSGSGIEEIDFGDVSQPLFNNTNHSKFGKHTKHGKHNEFSKHGKYKKISLKYGKKSKKGSFNITYGNLSLASEESKNSDSKYINPILISLGCAFIVIGSVLFVNKYQKKSGYNLVSEKNYNTFQNI